jgi:hypothetical protein
MKFLLKVYEASLSSLTCSLNLLIARALKFRDCVEYKYIFGSADVVPSKAVNKVCVAFNSCASLRTSISAYAYLHAQLPVLLQMVDPMHRSRSQMLFDVVIAAVSEFELVSLALVRFFALQSSSYQIPHTYRIHY